MIDQGVFTPTLHDSAAVLLPPSGITVLPLDDIQGCRRSTRDSVQYR